LKGQLKNSGGSNVLISAQSGNIIRSVELQGCSSLAESVEIFKKNYRAGSL
jgi:hypothetical protein